MGSAEPGQVLTVLLLALLAVAVVTDLAHHRIPNAVSLGAVVTGCLSQTLAAGLPGLTLAVGGLAVGLAVLLPMYLLGGMGAGDVKLLGGMGAFLGPTGALLAGAVTLVAGGILGLAVVLLKPAARAAFAATLRGTAARLRGQPADPGAPASARHRFPYALAIACGTLFALHAVGALEALVR